MSTSSVLLTPSGTGTLLDRLDVVPDPAFLPPGPDRSWRPRAVDDVWSLAAVLQSATTGEAPGGRRGARGSGWLTPLTELALAADDRDRPSMGEVADYLRARAGAGSAAVAASTAGRRRGATAIAAAVLVLLAVAGTTLLLTGGSGDPEPGRRSSATAPSAASPQPSQPVATASAPQVQATRLTAFARRYVRVASSDPRAGFRLLTPDYQRESPRSEQVWRSIREPRILAVSADPDTLSVTYTYRYRTAGGRVRRERVTLRLVLDGDRLLIAGATARPT